jgi:uncharacterized protein involved in exopolysaccharide biosynthesis
MIIDQQADERFMRRVSRVRRRWLRILQAAVLCAVAAAAVSLFLPDVYRATTYLLISESKIGEPSRDSNLQQMAMIPTFVPFLENDALISETLRKLRLHEPPHAMTVDRFRRNHMDVRIPRSARLLELVVEFPDARLAADLANEIAQGAVRFNDGLNASDTSASRGFLKKHLDEAAEGLEKAAARKLRAQEEARLEDREKDLAVLLAEKDSLYARVHNVRMDLAQNEVRAASLERALAGESETIALRKSVTSDRFVELVTEKLNLSEMPLTVTEESINQTRESLRRDFLNVTISTQAQKTGLAVGETRLAEVDRQISRLTLDLVSLRNKLAIAEQEYVMAADAVRNASREFEAASVTVSAKSQDMKQIAPALPPERPVGPSLPINMLAGFFLGILVFGGGSVALQSLRDVRGEDPNPAEPAEAVKVQRQ